MYCLQASKSKMAYTTKIKIFPIYNTDNNTLPFSDTVRDLGVTVDSNF